MLERWFYYVMGYRSLTIYGSQGNNFGVEIV